MRRRRRRISQAHGAPVLALCSSCRRRLSLDTSTHSRIAGVTRSAYSTAAPSTWRAARPTSWMRERELRRKPCAVERGEEILDQHTSSRRAQSSLFSPYVSFSLPLYRARLLIGAEDGDERHLG